MPTKVTSSAYFDKEFKYLLRKYPSVRAELGVLTDQLRNDQRPGDKLQGIGYETYKVRLRNRAARKGKSGGFRVIYYVRLADHVALLTIYTKTQQQDISAADIQQIIEDYLAQEDEDND
jgi:mRNA-degrading endonuclease RelE of RelBE toxin-antitoxin system